MSCHGCRVFFFSWVGNEEVHINRPCSWCRPSLEACSRDLNGEKQSRISVIAPVIPCSLTCRNHLTTMHNYDAYQSKQALGFQWPYTCYRFFPYLPGWIPDRYTDNCVSSLIFTGFQRECDLWTTKSLIGNSANLWPRRRQNAFQRKEVAYYNDCL